MLFRLLVAPFGIQYSQVITTLNTWEVQMRPPQTFLSMLVSSTDYSIHMMLTKNFALVQTYQPAYCKYYHVPSFLDHGVPGFESSYLLHGTMNFHKVKVNTTIECIGKEFKRLEFQPRRTIKRFYGNDGIPNSRAKLRVYTERIVMTTSP